MSIYNLYITLSSLAPWLRDVGFGPDPTSDFWAGFLGLFAHSAALGRGCTDVFY